MGSVGKPVPYVNREGCLEVDGMDMLRYQMVTQQLAAADNTTRRPQTSDTITDATDVGANGQYLRQPTVGTTSTISGSFAVVLTASDRRGDAASFGGRVYNGAQEPWYPYKAGSCGRGYQSPIMYGPTSVRQ